MKRPPASPLVPGFVRIIGGQWKRSKLPVAARPGLRPTPDRVRETLFNWLGQDLTGWRCLDAFAGSGALGFEAASRGAAEVLLLELDAALVQTLTANAQRLGAQTLRTERADALQRMAQLPAGVWDVIFLDPPFQQGQNDATVQAALRLARALLAPQGLLYLEAPRPWGAQELQPMGWALERSGKASSVHHHLLRAHNPAP